MGFLLKMRILLINPPLLARFRDYLVPPLGIAHIAATVRAEHETRIIDLNVERRSRAALLREVGRFDPDLVGMSVTTPTWAFLAQLAGEIKQICRAVVVCGGNHVSALPEHVLSTSAIDYVFVGEAEDSFRRFVGELDAGRSGVDVPGVGYRKADGSVHVNPVGPLVEDLDRLPLPAWDLLPMERYRGRLRGYASTLFTRGCPYSCTYCAAHLVHGKRVRRRSVDHIIDELRLLEERYGVSFVSVVDDCSTVDRELVAAFCEAKLSAALGMEFWCNTRVDLVDPELLGLMKRAGFAVISYGVESANDDTLSRIHKQTTADCTRQAVRWTREAGIIPEGFLMVNFPGETEAEMQRTIDFAFELERPVFETTAVTPYPGTEYYRYCEDRGPIDLEGADDFRKFWMVDEVVVDNGVVSPTRVRKLMGRARRRMFSRLLFYRVAARYFLRGARPKLGDVGNYLSYLPRLARELVKR